MPRKHSRLIRLENMNKFVGIVVAICVVIQAIDAYSVTCTYTKSENTVTCSNSSMSFTCGTAAGSSTVPDGEYKISRVMGHLHNSYPWHVLYPKSKTEIYYDLYYTDQNPKGLMILFHEEISGTHSRCIMGESPCYKDIGKMMLKATEVVTSVKDEKKWIRKYTIGDMTVL